MKLRSALMAAIFGILLAPANSCPCGEVSTTGDVPGAETFYFCGSPD